ncbi:MAG: sulfatase-like hydrolase/transferase [Verrucomicrobia bacterium]|nr:sulfatase-like hydrolase/transferase [Verrucomicrobiota bacterium]
MKTMIRFLLSCLLGAPWLLHAAPKPNILFIMADDIGWGDFQCYNPNGKIPTPNLDRLARQGMRFTDAHTPAALCAPTRYAVATGNYTWRGRLPGGTWGWNQAPQFLDGQRTIGHILQPAGYRTALFGKLHFGGVFESGEDGRPDFTKPMKVGPREWGFDYSYVLLGGHQAPPYLFFENNRVAGDPAQVTQLPQGPLNGGIVPRDGPGLPDWDSRKVGQALVEKIVAFIDDGLARAKHDGQRRPFYIHLSTDGAHGPYTPPETILGTPVKDVTRMTAHTDMVYEVDVVVGKLVEALTQRKLLADTLIVVTSDNGGIPTDRAHGHDAVGGLRGSKSLIWEGGHRVPLIAHWGDGTPAGSKVAPGTVRQQVLGTHDLVPTFAELAGARPGPDQALDSVSFASVLLGQRGDDQPVRQTLLIQSSPGRDAFTEGRGAAATPKAKTKAKRAADKKARTQQQRQAARTGAGTGSHGMAHALREGPWKLVMNIQDQPAALYNLDNDLAERNNLIQEPAHAERVQRMEKAYRDIRASQRSTPPL